MMRCRGNMNTNEGASRDGGQAMVEFTVGLVAAAVLLAGIVQFGMLARAHARTMRIARQEVAGYVLVPAYFGSLDARYTLDWTDGNDDRTYSRDDVQIENPAAVTASDVADAARLDPGALAGEVGPNPVSDLAMSPSDMTCFFLVHGHHSSSVTNMSLIRRLVFGADTDCIHTESDAFMVWATQIY